MSTDLVTPIAFWALFSITILLFAFRARQGANPKRPRKLWDFFVFDATRAHEKDPVEFWILVAVAAGGIFMLIRSLLVAIRA